MKSLNRININELIFFDIETAPITQFFENAPDHVAKEWVYKFKFRDKAPDISDTEAFGDYMAKLWIKEAALYAEFSRVVCIVAGFCFEGTFRVKRFFDVNEGKLLKAFADDMAAFNKKIPALRLCGHYIKGFDCPFITKRLIINRLEVPALFDTFGLKPWEIIHLDLHEVWKFGMGQSASLPSIAMALGLPSPKQDMEGADVAYLFFTSQIERILHYCTGDVVTVLNVFKVLRNELPYNDLQIEIVREEE